MEKALLLTKIVVGSAYVVVALLFLRGEISLFLYAFGWGILAAALLVLLNKTFPEQ